MAAKPDQLAALHAAWQRGGLLDALAGAGRDYDRVYAYLQAFAVGTASGCTNPMQRPGYPCFPGLAHAPWRDPADFAGVAALERAFDVIRDEYASLHDAVFLRYTPPSMTNVWQVHLLHHMGVDLTPWHRRTPAIAALIRGLPDVCIDYPWGDALLSVHASQAHLAAHCSIDNLRVRCHLGVAVPPGSEMRVGTATRTWAEGKGLVFEDSFEHEVWNRSEQRRAILIVDFWHPELTLAERRALSAAFRKSSVRRQFLLERLDMLDTQPPGLRAFLLHAMEAEDRDPALAEFWRR